MKNKQALTGRKAASLGPSSFTDKNLLELFHQQHHRNSPHPCYRKPRFDGPEFVIMHYAGDVREKKRRKDRAAGVGGQQGRSELAVHKGRGGGAEGGKGGRGAGVTCWLVV